MAHYDGLVDVSISAQNDFRFWVDIDGDYEGYKLFTGPEGTGMMDLSPYGLHRVELDAEEPSHDNLYDVTNFQDNGPLQPELLADHRERKSRESDNTQ